MLEELHLPQTLQRFFLRLVWPTHVFPFAGEHLVSSCHFLDHEFTSADALVANIVLKNAEDDTSFGWESGGSEREE